ncbi:MAG: mechanosensitive ion channel [Gloeomargarita sp. SKYB31]|nr:mechanosensitive ion channel [Gloeomargarita sp. SKYB31]
MPVGLLFGQRTGGLQLAQVTTGTERWINLNFERLVPFLFNLLGALGIFIIAWIVASLLGRVTQTILKRTGIDDRLSQLVSGTVEPPISVGKWLGQIIFWLVLLLGLVGALDVLNLSGVSQPLTRLLDEIFTYAPRLIGGLILAVIAWGVATVTKLVVVRLARSLQLDQPLELPAQAEGAAPVTVGETLGTALYWFVLLFFLPLILDTLQLQGPLQPVQNLLNELLAALPRILKAVLIGLVGWLVARVLRAMTSNLLVAIGADRLGQRIGIQEPVRLSQVGGGLVYVLVWIPTVVAALEALEIQAISQPAVAMLNTFLTALPRVFTASLILLVAYGSGRLLGEVVTRALTQAGFDQVLNWLGLPAPTEMPQTPSQVVGLIVLGGVVQLGIIAAVEVLEIPTLTAVATGLLVILGQVLVGLLVLAVGLYAANVTFRLIAQAGTPQARLLAHGARIATLALVGAMALRQMGIAADIVNLAFGLLFGAVAVAIAIAFGLGGRDVVAQQLQEWRTQIKRPPESE